MPADSNTRLQFAPTEDARRVQASCQEPVEECRNDGRFLAANRELQNFFERLESLSGRTDTVTEEELNRIWIRLMSLAPELDDTSSCSTIASDSEGEAAKYINNLKMLRHKLEEIRSVMLGRREQLELAGRHIAGLQGWVNAFRQTTCYIPENHKNSAISLLAF